MPTQQPFAVLYRWRLKPGHEERFAQGWRRVTEAARARCGSAGSCLHRGDDGVWVAYARWPDEQARSRCFIDGPLDAEASAMMHEATDEYLGETRLHVTDDLLGPRGGDPGS